MHSFLDLYIYIYIYLLLVYIIYIYGCLYIYIYIHSIISLSKIGLSSLAAGLGLSFCHAGGDPMRGPVAVTRFPVPSLSCLKIYFISIN